MMDIGVSTAELKTMKKEKIKLKIDEWKEKRWRFRVEEKVGEKP